ncbi:MAG: hypothetical protein ACF8NJ_04210 [Phycisphaerales bacterium JB038]
MNGRYRICVPVLRLLVLELVLGTATTWLIAWWFAVYGPVGTRCSVLHWLPGPAGRVHSGGRVSLLGYHAAHRERWQIFLQGDPADSRELIRDDLPPWSDFLRGEAETWRPPSWLPRACGNIDGTRHEWIEEAAGWPRLCLRWQLTPDGLLHQAVDAPAWLSGLAPPGPQAAGPADFGPGWRLSKGQPLPYEPIWAGMRFNIAVFGGLWGAVLLAGLAGRQLRRRRRGYCLACGYDLRGELGGGCPECGWGRGEEPSKECEVRS